MSGGPLKLGIVCYPTYGGSGIVATEVGLAMAGRGHRVHFIGYDTPRRYEAREGVSFHRVNVQDYPLFEHAPYALALASALVDVSVREGLDVVHVHYAVPHATSAYLAGEILGARAPAMVTTLHGTDITLVGSDPSYLPITRFSILKSDGVTVPSAYLATETRRRLDLPDLEVDVVPNFIDTTRFSPPMRREPGYMARLFAETGVSCGLDDDAPTLVHVSNFRAVKRVPDVVSVFAKVSETLPCRLVMVGDGPARAEAEAQVAAAGLTRRTRFLGRLDRFADVLGHGDVFLLPSESESFGVAALEAMAAGVPVVASAVGGLPEVVVDGETGRLVPMGDVAAFARATLEIAGSPAVRSAMGEAAHRHALARFAADPLLDRYEACYRRVLARNARR